MSAHWIWYPTLQPGTPPRVTLLMTWREGYYLADGSDAFVRAVLSEVGVREAVTRWSFQRYRCSYFSPDPEETSWDDLWPLAWKLSAELAEPPSGLQVLREDGRRETELTDDTWSAQNNPMYARSARCLVLGDFEDAAALRAARADITAALPAATLDQGFAFARLPQLQVDLGEHDDPWYQAGAPEARVARELCQKHGASVFFEHTLGRVVT